MCIEGDEPPREDMKASAIPPDVIKEPEPSPRDSEKSSECEEVDYDTDFEKSSECQEVDYDTDFEDNVSDTEQDKGTTRWTSLVIHNICVNTLRPRQDGRHFPDDIFKCIFLNENVWISLTISLRCVRKVRINNIPSLVQIMAWRRPGDKPLSEPINLESLTNVGICTDAYMRHSASMS